MQMREMEMRTTTLSKVTAVVTPFLKLFSQTIIASFKVTFTCIHNEA